VGWVDITEPYTQRPRIPDGLPTGAPSLPADGDPLDLYRIALDRRDLSQVRIASAQECHFRGCKLVGADLAGAEVSDVIFEDCSFRYANLRMARLERVRFSNCAFDETDAYEARLDDVDFADSRLVGLNIDGVRARRVDLRGATQLGLDGAKRLDGWLVTEDQLPALTYALAAAAGLDIEQPLDPEAEDG